MAATRESPAPEGRRWVRASDLSHGAATTEPLETSNLHLSSCPSSLPFATSRSRHPDNPTTRQPVSPFSLSNRLYIRSPSLILASRFSLVSLPSVSSPPRPSLHLDRDLPTSFLLFLLHLHRTCNASAVSSRLCVHANASLYIFRYFLRFVSPSAPGRSNNAYISSLFCVIFIYQISVI